MNSNCTFLIKIFIIILYLQKCCYNKKFDIFKNIFSQPIKNNEHKYKPYLFNENFNLDEFYKKLQNDFKSIEKHNITTDDGYILTAWHFNNNSTTKFLNNNKKVVMLQHGLLDDSYTWLVLKDKSLVTFLLENNFDVWLTNSRGNIFSTGHIDPLKNSTNHSSEYWNFTYSEMAKYDVPGNIKYILNYTNQENLYYIGHSQGTFQFYLAYTLYPEFLQKRVEKFVSIGTVFTLFHSVSSNFYSL